MTASVPLRGTSSFKVRESRLRGSSQLSALSSHPASGGLPSCGETSPCCHSDPAWREKNLGIHPIKQIRRSFVALQNAIPQDDSLRGFSATCHTPGLLRPDRVRPAVCLLPRKNSRNSAAQSSASTPETASGWWFNRGWRRTFKIEPHAPALGSLVPNTVRRSRACTMAPAHIAHGSIVTYRSQPSRR
jgi:hypothetical protein